MDELNEVNETHVGGPPCQSHSPEASTSQPLLVVRDLAVRFQTRRGLVSAVAGVSYTLSPGRALAIVGGSGSGKSVSCRALLGLLPDNARAEGSAVFAGKELVGLPEAEMRRHRGRDIAIAFQDADRALNPTMRIGAQIMEAMRGEKLGRKAARDRAIALLLQLGFADPRARLDAYPHQLSGGMRQRVTVAIALASGPRVLICDETTRSLDLVTQTLLIDLFETLKRRGTALIIVSHDLGLAARVADDVLVMHGGWPVEYAPTRTLFERPRMKYTAALLAARPGARGFLQAGADAALTTGGRCRDASTGCSYESSCTAATQRCAIERPPLEEHEPRHHWACWHPSIAT